MRIFPIYGGFDLPDDASIMLPIESLITTLSDGAFHSGVELGQELQVSRTAVWKNLQKLQEIGLRVEKVKGKGYRIPGGIDLLKRDLLLSHLSDGVKGQIAELELLISVDSTNGRVAKRLRQCAQDTCVVCLAEFQTDGRGRRGRTWVSSFAQNLCLSVGYSFKEGFSALDGLSLAVGVMVAEVLERCHLQDVRLKWPNDIWIRGRKVGGILIELSGEQGGPCQVVIGLGLNILMNSETAGMTIEQDWTSLGQETSEPVSRNRTAANMVEALVTGLALFEREGFSAFADRWAHFDALRDQPVRLIAGTEVREGVCRGIGRFGHLLFETPAGTEEVAAGEVSLRRL